MAKSKGKWKKNFVKLWTSVLAAAVVAARWRYNCIKMRLIMCSLSHSAGCSLYICLCACVCHAIDCQYFTANLLYITQFIFQCIVSIHMVILKYKLWNLVSLFEFSVRTLTMIWSPLYKLECTRKVRRNRKFLSVLRKCLNIQN